MKKCRCCGKKFPLPERIHYCEPCQLAIKKAQELIPANEISYASDDHDASLGDGRIDQADLIARRAAGMAGYRPGEID